MGNRLQNLKQTLLLFDIDGTLTDSTNVDDDCFCKTFNEIYGIDLSNEDWATFTHVTDTGLSKEIIKKYRNENLSNDDLHVIQKVFFYHLKEALDADSSCVREIPGAIGFVDKLRMSNVPVAIATGGWRQSADMKLQHASIPYEPFTLASSSDDHKRRTIMNIAIARAQFEYQQQFKHIIYFGDGIWDAMTCASMDIPMIGIGKSHESKFESYKIIVDSFEDFQCPDEIISRCLEVFDKEELSIH